MPEVEQAQGCHHCNPWINQLAKVSAEVHKPTDGLAADEYVCNLKHHMIVLSDSRWDNSTSYILYLNAHLNGFRCKVGQVNLQKLAEQDREQISLHLCCSW